MELRDWAIRILSSTSLEEKLFCPEILTDHRPGTPLIFNEPSRPATMGFNKRRKEEKLPPFQTHGKEENRAVCLHRFAGHELLAVEIMAQALTSFPEAPASFRKGVANTLKEEQGHVRLYCNRMEEMGLKFGDLPLYRHFWNQVPYLTSPLRYVSVMSLTFEMANLDFAPFYGKSFAHFGDDKSASLMARILRDEIRHVAFGWRMFQRLINLSPKQMTRCASEAKPDQNEACRLGNPYRQQERIDGAKPQSAGCPLFGSRANKETDEAWDIWTASLPPHLEPKRAKGFILKEENRKAAGIPQSWIEKLKNC